MMAITFIDIVLFQIKEALPATMWQVKRRALKLGSSD